MNLHRTRQGFDLPSTRALPLNYCAILEQVEGIEPSNSAWKADVLPLNYTCIKGMNHTFHPFALKSILGINAFNKTYVFPAIVEKHFKTPLRYVESHANFSFLYWTKVGVQYRIKSICIVPILTLLTHHLGFRS